MSSDHIQPEEIKSFISGDLDDIESECIIQHLSECEVCLTAVDELWKTQEDQSGSLDQEKIKQRLLQKIYRTNLIGNFIKLSGKGFLYTIRGLMFPFHTKK
jgi:hypothetical protein